jgi:hypothetical protein
MSSCLPWKKCRWGRGPFLTSPLGANHVVKNWPLWTHSMSIWEAMDWSAGAFYPSWIVNQICSSFPKYVGNNCFQIFPEGRNRNF